MTEVANAAKVTRAVNARSAPRRTPDAQALRAERGTRGSLDGSGETIGETVGDNIVDKLNDSFLFF
jgi:hypothetical protein